jgi:hypothetical protein
MNEKREVYAYHEAGHAVVAMNLGYKCHRVWIAPEHARGSACCEDPRKTTRGTAQERYEHFLTIEIAAEIAQRKACPGSAPLNDEDAKKVIEAIIAHTDKRETDDVLRERQGISLMARAHVEEAWSKIQLLAQNLIKDGEVVFRPPSVAPAAKLD